MQVYLRLGNASTETNGHQVQGADNRIETAGESIFAGLYDGSWKATGQPGPLRRLDAVWPTILSLLFMVAPPLSTAIWLILKEPRVGFYHILERETIQSWRMFEISRF